MKGLPDLTDPVVRRLFGKNVAGVLKGGELLTPINWRMVEQLASELHANHLIVAKICYATQLLSPQMVRIVARILGHEVLWFFSRHKDEEFVPTRAATRRQQEESRKATLDNFVAPQAEAEHRPTKTPPTQDADVKKVVQSITSATARDAKMEEALRRRRELLQQRDTIIRQQREIAERIGKLNRDLAAVNAYFQVKASSARRR